MHPTSKRAGRAGITQHHMSKVLNKQTFPIGHVIFQEGAKGTHAYVVQKGAVQIQKKAADGKTITLGTVKNGGIFGEMALIDKSRRMATAVTAEDTICITIPEETLREKLQTCDPAIKMLIIVLIRMIRKVAKNGRLPADDLDKVMAEAEDDFLIEIDD